MKGQRNPVSLLTIASQSYVVIVLLQKVLLHGELPAALIKFLEDQKNTFVGCGWQQDARALEYFYDVDIEVSIFATLEPLRP